MSQGGGEIHRQIIFRRLTSKCFCLLALTNQNNYDIIYTESEMIKMARCPNCGSSSRTKLLTTEYNEDGWDIEVVHTYSCNCGCVYTGTSYYHRQECYEVIEVVPKKIVQEKMCNRG